MTERSPGVWMLRWEDEPDPVTGARRRRTKTVHGNRRKAQDELTRVQAAAPGRVEPTSATVGQLLERTMASIEISGRTRDDWTQVIDRFIAPRLAGVELRKLTPDRLDRLYADLRADGVTPWRVLKVHEILSTACANAVRWKWMPANPCADATRPRRPARKSRAHRDELVAALSARASSDHVWGMWFHVASLTGARRGELAALTWADVDLDAGTIRIDKAVDETSRGLVVKGTKTDDHRLLPLDRDTVAMLAAGRRRHMEQALAVGVPFNPSSYVFRHRGNPLGDRPMRPSAATHWFDRMRAEVGADDIRLQDLRHLAGSEMLDAGVDPKTVAYLLGHSVETLLENYAHVLDGRTEAAVQAMAAVLQRRRSG
jgi:integrase